MGLFDFVKKTLLGEQKKKRRSTKKVKKKTAKKPAKKPVKGAKGKSIKKPRKAVKKKKPTKPLKKRAPQSKEKQIGAITHYFSKLSVGIIKLKAELNVGDKIHIKGAHDDFTQIVKSMQYNHNDIPRAKKGLEIGIKVPQKVHENDKVYKPA